MPQSSRPIRLEKRNEFSRGKSVLTASTLGISLGVLALVFYGMGSFTSSLQQEFGWSRAQISSAFLYVTIAIAISSPILGWLIDRYGPRTMSLIGIPILTLGFVWLSRFDDGIDGFLLTFGFLGLAASGTTALSYTRAINGAFVKARGLALGIALGGLGVAAMLLPMILNPIITSYGWRAGFAALAALSMIPFPFVFLGMRGRAIVPAAESLDEVPVARPGATHSEAVRSRPFWQLLITFIFIGFAAAAAIPHMIPLLTDAGVSSGQAAFTASTIGVGIIIGRVGVGWLVDRFFAPYVGAPLFFTTALGCLLLEFGSASTAPIAAFLIGITVGAETDLVSYLTARYFGLRSYGFVYGIVFSIFNLATALGPMTLGAIYDATGSYDAGLTLVAALLAVGSLLILSLPRFDRFTWKDAFPLTAANRTNVDPVSIERD